MFFVVDDDDVKHTRNDEEASHNTRSDEAVCHSAGYSSQQLLYYVEKANKEIMIDDIVC
jgi:hypothetical protein